MTAFKTTLKALGVAAGLTLSLGATSAFAQSCGNGPAGFEQWKQQFAGVAQANGVGNRGLQALAGARYNDKTIRIDRAAQKGGSAFTMSLDTFLNKRGGASIVSTGKKKLAQNKAMFADIQNRYGITPGPILAIWGMETGFGGFMGSENVVSSAATIAYDCRRSDFFKPHLVAALKLIDRGGLSPNSRGAGHGEFGHTQFLANNILQYGVDGDGDGRVDLSTTRDALYSTANFLRQHGMTANYQQGQAGYRGIQGWNAAPVYQQAIAYLGAQIDS
ncbi:lytic murein transglycosylase [Fulvimarina sp. 2208YS6-2-32]|uniref:Lytic murein transglycosylase n=1 Tax=Fulvimarina uroteuthidis TaxID=3098149 RepID=A0ABU5I117_9HYPH|nr:lytic murein transglycosylase [Fulvimarina sp. 2208YS6-2-32]MDY8109069.1 lytic murein transglycosylase [Fulvimarina sp. 2208YS6-2-32]